MEHVHSDKIDICTVTATWLKPADDAIQQQYQPVGYSFTDYPLQMAGWVATVAYCAGQILHHLWCDQERTSHLMSLNGS